MKDVLEYLFGRLKDRQPVTVEVDGQHYTVQANGTLGNPVRKLAPQWDAPVFNVSTLGALVAACKAKIDDFGDDVALHIKDHVNVDLVSTKADEFGRRHVYIHAHHEHDCPFLFGQFMEIEKFQIDFRASFFLNDEALKVLTVLQNLESGQAISTADDGLSQRIEVKIGTVSKTAIVLPADGVPLIPWRTFREAAPVESKFLLRLKQVKDDLPKAALFDIDTKWKLDTMGSIATFLDGSLDNLRVIA